MYGSAGNNENVSLGWTAVDGATKVNYKWAFEQLDKCGMITFSSHFTTVTRKTSTDMRSSDELCEARNDF
jgi:hypothetical protein